MGASVALHDSEIALSQFYLGGVIVPRGIHGPKLDRSGFPIFWLHDFYVVQRVPRAQLRSIGFSYKVHVSSIKIGC